MDRKPTIIFAALAIALFPALAPAQPFDLSWYTLDGGGGMFGVGGPFELSGTIAQYDAGATMTGGPFELMGGFWAGIDPVPCPGDVSGDDVVDLTDLTQLLSNYGTLSGASRSDGDLDADGDVDLGDLTTLLSNFGTSCP